MFSILKLPARVFNKNCALFCDNARSAAEAQEANQELLFKNEDGVKFRFFKSNFRIDYC